MNPTEEEDYHYRFKVVVLGDTKSGKTTFLDSNFIQKYNLILIFIALTESNGKVLNLEASEEISERITIQAFNHMIFRVTYWELPGKERHLQFLKNYCLGAAVAIVLFDTTKASSLEKAENILKSIENCEIPIKYLICNKVDLLNSKKNISNPVSQQDANTVAKNYNCDYFNCNATGVDYVGQIYNSMTENIIKLIGNNLELRNLIGKNISVGKKLFNHPNFLQSLKDSQYFKD